MAMGPLPITSARFPSLRGRVEHGVHADGQGFHEDRRSVVDLIRNQEELALVGNDGSPPILPAGPCDTRWSCPGLNGTPPTSRGPSSPACSHVPCEPFGTRGALEIPISSDSAGKRRVPPRPAPQLGPT